MNRIARFLDGKVIFITGATGFLGQPLVEKILWTAPSVRRIHVLIRPKRTSPDTVLTAPMRLEKELYESSVFDRLRSRHGDDFLPFLRDKLVAVAGDISQDGLGIDAETRAGLQDSVDVFINSAAVVSFDAPLDEALQLNVLGARRAAEFAAGCRKAVLVHVSTAYVSGATHHVAPETLYHTAPAARGADPFPAGQFRDVDADLRVIEETVAGCLAAAQQPDVDRDLKRALLRRLRSGRGGKVAGRRKMLESLRKKWLQNRLTQDGMRWARERGWNDTYTYTKALGEQMVMRHRGDMPTVIVRPSVIESSLSEPSPGWLDGLRMADPLIAAIGKGRLRALPLKPDVHLDLVPVDMVVNALLASIPHAAIEGGLQCYQVATASRNPISIGDLYDLIYRYFVRNPMLDKAGRPIRIRRLSFPNRSAFRLQHRLRSIPLETAEKTLDRLSHLGAAARAKRRVSATRAAHERLYYYGEIYEPYLNSDCRFEVDRTMALYHGLDEDEKRQFNFDVTRLNWRHYIQNVHVPGVKKFVLKMEGNAAAARAESERAAAQAWTIPDLLAQSAARFGAKTALQVRRNGAWERFSFADLERHAQRVARQFRRMGLHKGDRVVLYSENQPEWGIAWLGASIAGLVVVPLDAQTWQKEVWSVARFTEARALLASAACFKRLTPEGLLENERSPLPVKLLDVNRLGLPFMLHAYPRSTQVEEVPALPAHDDAGDGSPSGLAVGGSEAMAALGIKAAAKLGGGDATSAAFEPSPVSPDDPASIIFTTGTASDPRGAVHTHRSFLSNVYGVTRFSPLDETDCMLSVLPLYHTLEFSCGFLAPLYRGATVTYAGALKPKMILETMRETGTTCMLGVPTLYALLRDDIERRILKSSRSSFKTNLAATSRRISKSFERRFGKSIGRQLFARVHEEFGGRIRFLVSGGSALGSDLYEYFRALGMPLYEGYGLTETAPVLTFTPFGHSRAGSMGKPLPGVELRLSRPDRDGVGEIVVRTPSLMQGYYKNPEATARAIQNGWFHTGDLGWVDEDGYVYFAGRIKDVIVTGAGKNVYPADLEAIYASIPGIREICVVGLKSGLTEDVHAVIVPEPAASAPESAEIKKALQRDIQLLARDLPSYHRLQYVHVWRDALPRTDAGTVHREAVRRRLTAELRERPASGAAAPASFETGQEEEILEELARLSGVPAADLGEDSDLYSDLGLDSLEAIQLLLFLETRFGIVVPDEEADRVRTVGQILHGLYAPTRSAGRQGAPIRSALPSALRTPLDRALQRAAIGALDVLYRTYFRLRLAPPAELPRGGAYIIAANHSSHLDMGAIVAAVCRALGRREAERLHVLGAQDYFFDKPLKGWFFSTFFNVVPIRRDQTGVAGLRMAQAILAGGEPVLIFPEATRSRSGALQSFKPGLGLLALESNVPIVPAHIRGTYAALPAGRRVPRPAEVGVRFGPVLDMQAYGGGREAAPRDEVYRRIVQDVRRTIEHLAAGGEPPAPRPPRPPQPRASTSPRSV
jgi:long-chain acyl-CoA synthetase